MKSNDLYESEHLSIWKCSGKTNERSWNCLYSIIHWFKAANISAFLYFWSYGLEWNNRQPSNMKHYQAWGFFLIGIFDISLFSSLPWSLITYSSDKIWSCCCFTFSPKCIWCDENYFSPFFLSLTNFVGCKKKKKSIGLDLR